MCMYVCIYTHAVMHIYVAAFLLLQYFHDKAVAREIENTIINCPQCSWTGKYCLFQVRMLPDCTNNNILYVHIIYTYVTTYTYVCIYKV